MTHREIVMKLVGEISPIGESSTDKKRFENLKTIILLTESLLYEIGRVAQYKNRQEYSMNRAGEYAHKFLVEQIEEMEAEIKETK